MDNISLMKKNALEKKVYIYMHFNNVDLFELNAKTIEYIKEYNLY